MGTLSAHGGVDEADAMASDGDRGLARGLGSRTRQRRLTRCGGSQTMVS